MRRTRVSLTAGVLAAGGLLAAAPARAEITYNGYLSERLQVTAPMEGAPISTRDLAILQSLSEANLQARFRGLDDKLTVYADLSAFASFAGGYADTDPGDGRLHFVPEHDVANYRPLFVISEAYAGYDFFDHLSVLAGKKRVVWGSGQAWNPADIINPPRDPTDPNFQRAGTYMLKVDAPFELFTLSALVAPKALYTNHGIPYAFFMYPGHDPQETEKNPTVFPSPRDGQMHYAVAARLYALILNSDLNAWITYTNRFNDDLENKPRVAFSFSRYFFTDYEFHVEALGQLGSARTHFTSECVASDASVVGCLSSGTALATQKYRDSTDFFPRLLFGTRAMFKDESILNLEYLYQADGYTPDEFRDAIRFQQRVGNFTRSGASVPAASGGASSSGGLPTRFSFEPLRRHYLLVNYLKSQIMDDFAVNVTWIAALEDGSSSLNGFATWTAQQWLTLSLYAFLPLPSPGHLSRMHPRDPLGELAQRLGDDWGTLVPLGAEADGDRFGEYDASIFRGRVVLETRIFF
ncbi:MAG: hypothetical protein HY904_05470 [Deltaproteobacteria bacterium]|nr:hypothetical protein [Deltaproteobacteria bacterium]